MKGIFSMLFAIVLTVFVIFSLVYVSEKAYFEGQVDALKGDIRIKSNVDSCYYWIKSPWDNGDKPIFKPDCWEKQYTPCKH